MIQINEIFKLTQGQGHKVRGQGWIYNCLKKIGLPLTFELLKIEASNLVCDLLY